MQQPFMYGQPPSFVASGHPQPVMYNPPTMGMPVIVQVSPTPTPQTIYFVPAQAPSVSVPAPQQIVYTPPPIPVVKATEEKSLLPHLALALLLLILAITAMALAAYVVWQLEYNCSYPQLIPKWSTQRFSQQDAIAVANAQMKAWNTALGTKDKGVVSAMYAKKDLSFLPTVSAAHVDRIMSSYAGQVMDVQRYFEYFLKSEPKVTVTKDKVQAFGCRGDVVLHTGLYTVGTKDGDIKARFSFLHKKDASGKWWIHHHHSSALPDCFAPGCPQ